MSYMRMQEGDNALESLDEMCRLRDQLLEMGAWVQCWTPSGKQNYHGKGNKLSFDCCS